MVGLKAALRRKLEMKVPMSEQRLLDDPYLRLGYGMHSYFQVLLQLMCLMLMIMVLSVPLMITYSTFDAFKNHDTGATNMNQYSLGNLGGAKSICMT